MRRSPCARMPLAAMALIDAAVRLLPGVIGSELSYREESFEGGLLEYPHYTRPRIWRDREVPEVLLSGHHGKVDAWRKAQAEKATPANRIAVTAGERASLENRLGCAANRATAARAANPVVVFMVCSPESELAGMTKTDCQFHEVHFVG